MSDNLIRENLKNLYRRQVDPGIKIACEVLALPPRYLGLSSDFKPYSQTKKRFVTDDEQAAHVSIPTNSTANASDSARQPAQALVPSEPARIDITDSRTMRSQDPSNAALPFDIGQPAIDIVPLASLLVDSAGWDSDEWQEESELSGKGKGVQWIWDGIDWGFAPPCAALDYSLKQKFLENLFPPFPEWKTVVSRAVSLAVSIVDFVS